MLFSCAAILDRERIRAVSRFKNASELGAAQRRQLEQLVRRRPTFGLQEKRLLRLSDKLCSMSKVLKWKVYYPLCNVLFITDRRNYF